jgi:hypothetical protein
MGQQKPIHTNTVETMIEGYVTAELKKRKGWLTKPA